MDWKKGCLIAAGIGVVFMVLIGVAVGVAFYFTGDAATAANEFLGLVGDGKMSEAYQATAPALQKQMDEDEFTEAVKQLGLEDYASASWLSRNVDAGKGEATLEGTVKTKSGDEIPLSMTLTKADDKWKVFSFEGKQAGAKVHKGEKGEKSEKGKKGEGTEKASADQPPSDQAAKKMAAESVLALNEAVLSKDFQSFYDYIAKTWQKQITPKKLQAAFQSFIDQEIDLSGIKDVESALEDKPALDEDGLLAFSGYYPTKPSRVMFELKYIFENDEWKLISINVNVKPVEETKETTEKPEKPAKTEKSAKGVPSDDDAKALALESVLGLNQAVLDKDFQPFYKSISKTWQKQIKAQGLQDTFQVFIDNNIDMSEIKDQDPTLTKKPSLKMGGILTFAGYYPTKPNKVYFDLQYIKEGGQWKLFAIEVNIKK